MTKGLSRRDFLKLLGVSGVAAMAAPSLIGCGSTKPTGKGPLKIKWAQVYTEEHEKYLATGSWKFKELIEKKSNGEIKCEIYPGGQLGAHKDLIPRVQRGELEFSHASSQNLAQFVPQYNLIDLPYLIPDDIDSFNKLMASDVIEKHIHKPLRENGLEVIYYAPAGWRILGVAKHIKKDIRLPKDVEGLKVRVTASVAEQQGLKMAGANPTPVAWGETYNAMQQGVVDAAHVGAAPFYVYKIYETFGQVTKIHFMTSLDMHVMSKKWFDSLPKDYQELIKECAKETRKWCNKVQFTENNPAVYKKFEESGIKIHNLTAEEKKVWKETIGHQKPAWKEYIDKWGREAYEDMAKFSY